MSKYNSKKTTIGCETFDSKKEAQRWQELRLMEKCGNIHDLRRQVPFVLIPAQYETYPRWSKKTGSRIVEDSKGVRTADYIIKRKLMLYIHGIRIVET